VSLSAVRATGGVESGRSGFPVPGWECSRPGQEGPYTSLIWPEDHAWVIASEEDWDSTIVAGSRALVGSILADDRYEAFEVNEDDDLSWDGDLLNPRRLPGSAL